MINPKDRPAETMTVAAGVAYLIAYVLGALEDKTLLVALAVVIAAVPGAVTWAVVTFRGKR